ncbi:hypothetical protein TCCBUS3UF1_16240 [Thermus sp. CCB_US3_UF1]|nr:hypothetical protein TCCBUS3UF1_16240 [Thermus sp. CCB_US3_UF1]
MGVAFKPVPRGRKGGNVKREHGSQRQKGAGVLAPAFLLEVGRAL